MKAALLWVIKTVLTGICAFLAAWAAVYMHTISYAFIDGWFGIESAWGKREFLATAMLFAWLYFDNLFWGKGA